MTNDFEYLLNNLLPYYRDHEKMKSLWSDNERFSVVFETALEVDLDGQKTMLHAAASFFINFTSVFLIQSHSELIKTVNRIRQQKKRVLFINLFCINELVPSATISSILKDEKLLKKIGSLENWIETPAKINAQTLIRSARKNSLNIESLIPKHLKLNAHLEEYFLGWAYEENKLSSSGIDFFKENFNKKYELLKSIKNH